MTYLSLEEYDRPTGYLLSVRVNTIIHSAYISPCV